MLSKLPAIELWYTGKHLNNNSKGTNWGNYCYIEQVYYLFIVNFIAN